MECTDKVSDKGHSLDVHFGLPGNVAVELRACPINPLPAELAKQ